MMNSQLKYSALPKTNNKIRQVSKQDSKLFQRYFNRATQFQSQNKIELAIEWYENALRHNNDHLPTLHVLALLLQQSKYYEKAIRYYKLANKIHRHSATLENALGNCYEHCHQWGEAKKHYTHAIELRQDHAESFNNLGNLCRKMGDFQQAEFNLLRSLQLNIHVTTLLNLGLLMGDKRNYRQAHSFFDHALRIQPFNKELKWHKALLLLSESEFKQEPETI